MAPIKDCAPWDPVAAEMTPHATLKNAFEERLTLSRRPNLKVIIAQDLIEILKSVYFSMSNLNLMNL